MNFNIIMLGPKGVAKTSMLTTMWDEISRENDIFIIKSTDERKSYDLANKLAELKNIENFPSNMPIKEILQGTDDLNSYPFSIHLKNDPKELFSLNFFDHAGGIFAKGPQSSDYQQVVSTLKTSSVIIIPVDMTVMMELEESDYYKFYNPQLITNLISQNFGDSTNRLVIIALTKCEKYLKDSEETAKMILRFKTIHSSMLTALKNHDNNLLYCF